VTLFLVIRSWPKVLEKIPWRVVGFVVSTSWTARTSPLFSPNSTALPDSGHSRAGGNPGHGERTLPESRRRGNDCATNFENRIADTFAGKRLPVLTSSQELSLKQ